MEIGMDWLRLIEAAQRRGNERIRFWLATGHQQDYKLDDWTFRYDENVADILVFEHKTKHDSGVMFIRHISVVIFDL